MNDDVRGVFPPYKLVLLGDSSVGKTSLVNRFASDNFDAHTSNTIGAAFITKEFESINGTQKGVKFEIWDTAGQERYRSLTPMYYRNARAALVCYDLSNVVGSFEKSKYWIAQLQLHNLGEGGIEIFVTGTKSDLRTDPSDTTVDEYCAAHGLIHLCTSAKLGEGVAELFSAIVDGAEVSLWTEHSKRQHDAAEATGDRLFGSVDFLNPRKASGRCC